MVKKFDANGEPIRGDRTIIEFQAEVVRREVGHLLLYVPVVHPREFDVAIAYLVRRLEENAAPANFMSGVFDLATERALGEAMRRGTMVPVSGKMLLDAGKEVKPSTRKWFESAKNYALYANQSGFYDDVLVYMGLKK